MARPKSTQPRPKKQTTKSRSNPASIPAIQTQQSHQTTMASVTQNSQQTNMSQSQDETEKSQASTQLPSQTTENCSSQPTNSPEKEKSKNLVCTPGMERSALELYVQAVESGKRGEGGFKPEVHPWVASELLKEFPGNPFTLSKVKSKYTQGVKQTYDAFVACKSASGFGWNEAESMVTASEDVWNAFLVIIFEGHTARGDMRRSSGTEISDETSSAGPGDTGILPETSDSTRAPAQHSGVRPPCRHRITSGDRFEYSIDRLVDAFVASNADVESPESSPIHLATVKFQDKFAENLSMDELVTGFTVLESEAKARCFLAIRNDDHARAWIDRQIATKMATANY
ncbi:hypothetical protein PGTUg99_031248 [Puccinia graminis f. sp. tritici]|uniref:Myb/SANT-like domain-containing protein n=1 Tax=Puccinia graminis f. sp. tritici TaxID=56615 RepID=A0A5B0RGA0_PUCGR|nr:hypothetical protein PGTUg99_031248 [Puccinia graminis f. sp. tritici]